LATADCRKPRRIKPGPGFLGSISCDVSVWENETSENLR
jgi:hypothetical protein